MSAVYAKLNARGHARMVVLNAPESFEQEVAGLEGMSVDRSGDAAGDATFALAFGTTLDQVNAFAQAAATTAGHSVVWFAYPKGSSKRYTCEFNRDTGWAAMGAAGFEPVRQVAIDGDWSALRFRRVEHIKTMKRSAFGAISEQGKQRTAK